jgi:site-specific DNA recombinase
MKLKKYRIAFYVRAKPGNEESLTSQKRQLEKFVKRRGQFKNATIETYSDCCDSTYNLGPEYERLTQDVKDGKIDVVIVRDVGRICRCGLELEAFLHLMRDREFRFISAKDDIDLKGSLDLEFYEEEVT